MPEPRFAFYEIVRVASADPEMAEIDGERGVGVALRAVEEQYFDLPLPGTPDLMADWSDWLRSPYLSNRTPPPPDEALALRYRVVARPE